MQATTLFAPAKINLGLRITGRYPNGYHHLETLFAPIALYDRLTLIPATQDAIVYAWPRDATTALRRTLALGAAKNPLLLRTLHFMRAFLRRDFAYTLPAIAVHVHKRIPSPSGLGGASSDAAVLIKALLGLVEAEITETLLAETTRLGADIPFFLKYGLNGQPGYLRGIGHELTPVSLPSLTGFTAVPAFGFSTEKMFAHVRTLPLPTVNTESASSAKVNLALRLNEIPCSDETYGGVKIVQNDFDAVARAVFPAASQTLDQAKQVIARTVKQLKPVDWYVGLTGSGAGLFAATESAIDRTTLTRCSGILKSRLGYTWQVMPWKIGP